MAKNVFKVLIMTAIQAEFDAVLSLLPNKINNIDINLGNYGFGYEDISINDKVEFYVGKTGQGNVNSSIKIQRFLGAHEFNLALFVGIAGIRKADFEVFDVVFAEKIGYHEMTKEEANETLSRPEIENINQELIDIASFLNHEINNDKIQNWFGKERIQTKNGNILSGEKIIENNFSQVGKRIHTDFNHMQVIEMEGFGFCKSCRLNNLKYFGVIRGISDIISNSVDTKAIDPNSSKRDSNTITYASKNAAIYSIKFIKTFLELQIKKKSLANNDTIPDLNIFEKFNQLNKTLIELELKEKKLNSDLTPLNGFAANEENQDKKEYFNKQIINLNNLIVICSRDIETIKEEISVFKKSINAVYESTNYRDSSTLTKVRAALDLGNLSEANEAISLQVLKRNSENYLRTKKLLSNSGNILAQEYIAKANLTIATKNNIERFSEAALLYEEAAKSNSDCKISFDIALFFEGIGNYETAIKQYENTITLNPEKILLGQIYHNLGIIFRKKNNFESGEKYFNKAIFVKKELAEANPFNNLIFLGNTYSAFGVFYSFFNKQDLAIYYFKETILILEELNEKYKLYYGDHFARVYNNYANHLREKNELEKSEELYLKSIEISKKYLSIGDNEIISNLLNSLIGICNLYLFQNNFPQISKYIPELLEHSNSIFKTEPLKYIEIYCKANLIFGQLYSSLNKPQESYYYFNRILEIIPKPIEQKHMIIASNALLSIAAIYTFLQKDFVNFTIYNQRANVLLEILNPNIIEVQNSRIFQNSIIEGWK